MFALFFPFCVNVELVKMSKQNILTNKPFHPTNTFQINCLTEFKMIINNVLMEISVLT